MRANMWESHMWKAQRQVRWWKLKCGFFRGRGMEGADNFGELVNDFHRRRMGSRS